MNATAIGTANQSASSSVNGYALPGAGDEIETRDERRAAPGPGHFQPDLVVVVGNAADNY